MEQISWKQTAESLNPILRDIDSEYIYAVLYYIDFEESLSFLYYENDNVKSIHEQTLV